MPRVRVWDLPTRLFHWLLLLAVVGLFVTANVGGNWMNWHLRLGYCVMGLLLFRLLWGFVGGYWSRFGRFVYGPRAIWDYLQGRGPRHYAVGHSPLGALSVFALLLVLAAQVGSGLMTDDAIAFFGPLVPKVSSHMVDLATWYHKDVGRFAVLGLVGLHVLAIAYYRWVRRQRLTAAMVHGDKELDFDAPASRDGVAQWAAAAVAGAVGTAVVVALVRWGSGF